MSKRLTDEAMKRIAEDGYAGAMLMLWQEACRARESEAALLEALKGRLCPNQCLCCREEKALIAKAEGV